MLTWQFFVGFLVGMLMAGFLLVVYSIEEEED